MEGRQERSWKGEQSLSHRFLEAAVAGQRALAIGAKPSNEDRDSLMMGDGQHTDPGSLGELCTREMRMWLVLSWKCDFSSSCHHSDRRSWGFTLFIDQFHIQRMKFWMVGR